MNFLFNHVEDNGEGKEPFWYFMSMVVLNFSSIMVNVKERGKNHSSACENVSLENLSQLKVKGRRKSHSATSKIK